MSLWARLAHFRSTVGFAYLELDKATNAQRDLGKSKNLPGV